MVKYTYDTWGKVLSVTDANGTLITDTNHIGHRNPIRYRGYYYDIETGLYYLQSRYYDPEVGRFTSSDAYISTGQSVLGFNMFAYCGNNPVNMTDFQGTCPIALFVGGLYYLCTLEDRVAKANYKNNKEKDQTNGSVSTYNKIIDTQYGDVGSNFKYGCYNVSWNGCEAIALHNALVLSGKNSCLSEVIYDFQSCDAMLFWGFFGSDPRKIGCVLDQYNVQYSKINISEMTEPGIYIISYWSKTKYHLYTLHTIAVEYNGTSYLGYNYGNGINPINPVEYEDKFICGYRLR